MYRNLKFLHMTDFFSTDTVLVSVTNMRYEHNTLYMCHYWLSFVAFVSLLTNIDAMRECQAGEDLHELWPGPQPFWTFERWSNVDQDGQGVETLHPPHTFITLNVARMQIERWSREVEVVGRQETDKGIVSCDDWPGMSGPLSIISRPPVSIFFSSSFSSGFNLPPNTVSIILLHLLLSSGTGKSC